MLIATLDDGVELQLLELRHAVEYHRLVADNYERLYWLPAPPTAESTERRLRGGSGPVRGGIRGGCRYLGSRCPRRVLRAIRYRSRLPERRDRLLARQGRRGPRLDHPAARAMLKHAFDELKLHRVELRCRGDQCPQRSGGRAPGLSPGGPAGQGRSHRPRMGRFPDLRACWKMSGRLRRAESSREPKT